MVDLNNARVFFNVVLVSFQAWDQKNLIKLSKNFAQPNVVVRIRHTLIVAMNFEINLNGFELLARASRWLNFRIVVRLQKHLQDLCKLLKSLTSFAGQN